MTIDGVRFVVAAILVVTLPAGLLYWFLVHPLADRLRRLGRLVAMVLVIAACLALVGFLYGFRSTLVGVDLGFRPPLAAVAVPVYALAVVLEILTRRHLTTGILVGMPELSRDPNDSRLLTQGIYARTRNPRYVAILVALLAFALALNYTGVWLLWFICFPAIYLLVRLEEAELRGRFGEPYERYCGRVPRFFPKLG